MYLKRLIVLFLVIICSHPIYSQCPPTGDIILYTQNDVVDFIDNYGTCEIIDGNLYIGSDVTDLSGLTAIRRVEGTLSLSYSDNPSVDNFANLEYVGGDFEIDQCHNIEVVQGINKLHTVNGNFIIAQNYNNLKLINGFTALQHVGKSFQIARNNALTSLTEFENLTHINGRMILSGNNAILNINGFNALEKIGTVLITSSFDGNLNIEDNRLLEEIDGFNSLKEIVRNIIIGRNNSLKRIVGFTNLQLVTSILAFEYNPMLASIPTFENLTTIGSGLTINETGLSTITGFNNIQVIGDLSPSWGNLIIRKNRDLVTINGFARLSKLEGGLSITQHPKLIEMNGLLGLIEVRGVNIAGNDILTHLNGLQNLMRVEIIGGSAISVRLNPSLTDCSALCDLLTRGTVVGTIYFGNNPSKCSSEMEVREECIPDFDDDGVLDDDDLDDDNDGILDSIEQNGILDRDSDNDGFPDHMDLDSDNDNCSDVIEAGFTDSDDNGTLGNLPDTVDVDGLIIGESDGYTQPLDNDNDLILDFQEANTLSAGSDNTLKLCSNHDNVDLFTILGGNPDIGGVWSPPTASRTGTFNPSVDLGGKYTYTVSNGICGDSSAIVDVIVDQLPQAGSDGILTICSNDNPVNLVLSLGGTPDTVGTWSPVLTSGTDMFNPAVDQEGIYVYTVSNGNCEDVHAEVEVTINTPPNSGSDSVINVCMSDSPINLFQQLNGMPEVGGVWSPALASGTANLDPLLDLAGKYTYSITSSTCPDSAATVTVHINQEPNAGTNSTLSICTQDSSIDLFDSLGDTPDEGGQWNPSLTSGTGIFDPRVDVTGTYTYTVTNDNCGDDQSQVEVTVHPIPNAGEYSELSICINSGLVDLFGQIEGTPNSGGIWSPNLASDTNIFDPRIDKAGIYTYIVTSDLCGSDTSQLEVSILEVTPIATYSLETEGWNNDNTVSLQIATELQYEYALDGNDYQFGNTFRNVIGGMHTIFAREINGCGILEEHFVIIDYPRFFTPNADGVNDTWQLIGLSDEQYTLNIFNRYGKLVMQLSTTSPKWNGTYNAQLLPSSDYWFKVYFESGQIQTGHFSLKR